MYTYRPRTGVKEPGEVYSVIKDQHKMYGVPYKFTEDNYIPIYSTTLKERLDDGFIIIEGPCIFKDPEGFLSEIFGGNISTVSDSYINIEYKDSRGKPKMFREGVPPKKIIYRKKEDINTCARFEDMESCDDPKSYSLDVDGLKAKCKWTNDKCTGIFQDTDELEEFNISEISFEDGDLNELWKNAVDKAIEYVEQLTKLNNFNIDQIKIATGEQKIRLFEYYKLLKQKKESDKDIPEEITEVRYINLMEEISDILTPPTNQTVTQKVITDGYIDVTIYELVTVPMKLPLKVKLGKEYTINGKIVIPKKYNLDDNTWSCEIKDTDQILQYNAEEFRKKSNQMVVKPVPVHCFIDKKNEELFENPSKIYKSYYWYERKQIYTKTSDGNIFKEEKNNTRKDDRK